MILIDSFQKFNPGTSSLSDCNEQMPQDPAYISKLLRPQSCRIAFYLGMQDFCLWHSSQDVSSAWWGVCEDLEGPNFPVPGGFQVISVETMS